MRSKKLGSLHNALIGLALFAFPSTALAFDWGLKLEPGMAAAAGEPQSRLFGPGFGGSIKGLIGIGRYLDAQAGITYIGLPSRAGAPSDDIGGAWGFGAGMRLKRPHDLARGYSPWLDGDSMYVRTGDLNRFGFSVGAGLSAALDEDRRFWLGPFVRYVANRARRSHRREQHRRLDLHRRRFARVRLAASSPRSAVRRLRACRRERDRP